MWSAGSTEPTAPQLMAQLMAGGIASIAVLVVAVVVAAVGVVILHRTVQRATEAN